MKNLIEIVQVLSTRQIKSLEVFHPDTTRDDDSHYARFYRNIENGTYNSDEDAAADLYDSKPSDKRYQMLKSRVRKRLLNSLFFLDMQPPVTTQIGETHYEATKALVQASMLHKYGAANAGAELARKNLARAKEVEMTEVEIFQTRHLKRYLSTNGDGKEYKKLTKELERLLQAFSCELRAENYFDDITSKLQKTGAREATIIGELDAYIHDVDAWRKQHNRFVLHKYFYLLSTWRLQLEKNFRETIDLCDEFEKFLHEKPLFYRRMLHIRIGLKKLYCALHLRNYDAGIEFADQYIGLCEPESEHWFLIKELHLLLCIPQSNFDKAMEVYQRVLNSRNWSHNEARISEKWRIYRAYMDYAMLHAGRNDKIEDENTIRTTKDLENFVRELPTYSKDKRGFYVSIIIVQILFMLEWGNIDGIIDRIESIKRYIGRYLRRPEYHRSYCFMKLLLIMEKKNFDPVAVRAAGKRYYEKLTPSDNQDMSALDTLEIIPLDDLWVNILRTLERLKKQGTIV